MYLVGKRRSNVSANAARLRSYHSAVLCVFFAVLDVFTMDGYTVYQPIDIVFVTLFDVFAMCGHKVYRPIDIRTFLL